MIREMVEIEMKGDSFVATKLRQNSDRDAFERVCILMHSKVEDKFNFRIELEEFAKEVADGKPIYWSTDKCRVFIY